MEYEGTRRITYDTEDGGKAVFIPVCEKCHRFVKSAKSIRVNDISGLVDEPNAVCSKCGETKMIFEGFF